MKVAVKVQVDILARRYLRVTAAGRSALYTENRPQARLSKRGAHSFADTR